jgi:hypothetical protein
VALRSAARVVADPSEVGAAAGDEIAHPQRRRAARLRVARPLFHDPGNATERALTLIYELVDLPAYHVRDLSGREQAVGASL